MFQQAKKGLAAAAVLAAAALGGSAIANAASSGTTGPTGSSSSSSARPAFNGPAPGTAAHEDSEKAVTGTAAAKAKTAAVSAAGGGTAGAVTSNYTDNGYEVTVTKSDGSQVVVHVDSSFQAEQGPGGGGPPSGAGPGA